jgi:hypothetical protein
LSNAAIAASSYDALTVTARRSLPRPRPLASKEDDVKELTLEEVLRIAGGVPVSAALDELTYRTPQESARNPVDYARLSGKDLLSPEPT